MADTPDTKHEQARDLAEEALDKLVQGKDGQAEALIEEAKKIDPSGVQELLDDLDEDAADRNAAHARQQDRHDQTVKDSFPASDPPANTGITGPGKT